MKNGVLLRGVLIAAVAVSGALAGPAERAQGCEKPDINASVMLHRHNMPQFCGAAHWLPMPGYPYATHGVSFDGVHDYLTRDGKLTGASDSPKVTGSFWIRRGDVKGKTEEEIYLVSSGANARFGIALTPDGKLRFTGADKDNKVRLDVTGGTAIADSGWHHVMFSFDLGNPAHRFVYLDDAAEKLTVTTWSQGSIGFGSATETVIGASAYAKASARQVSGGDLKSGKPGGFFNGGLADFWLDTGTWLDFSVDANRWKFISDIGSPVALGPQGAGPTSSAPEVFLSAADSASWSVNSGKGGGFTGHGVFASAK